MYSDPILTVNGNGFENECFDLAKMHPISHLRIKDTFTIQLCNTIVNGIYLKPSHSHTPGAENSYFAKTFSDRSI